MTDLTNLLADRYGFEVAALDPLPGYDDRNLGVTTREGERLVLKIAAAGTERVALEAQSAALRHLARVAPGLGLPRVRQTVDGEDLVELEGGHLRLMSWLEGTFLAEVPSPSSTLLQSLGAFLGTLALGLRSFSHPGVHRRLCWDLLQLPRESEDLGAIADVGRRRMLDHLLLEHELTALADVLRLPRGVIHNDANDHNVLVGPTDRVSGLIDFGDMLESVRVGELAVAATYAMFDREDPLDAAAAVVAGFHGVAPLEEAEIATLHSLVCARLCLSVIHSARAARDDPANRYATVSEDAAWRLIQRLLGTHPEAAEAAYRRASGLDAPRAPATRSRALESREAHLGRALSLHYRRPLKICRGVMQHLYDEDGRAYLDLVNNVCHVGHANPEVVRAAARQAARLNTNTRYLHDEILRFAERLLATLPPSLEVCFLVCTGSEANELALRLAATHTARREVLVVDHAYHGNTRALVDVSPYKFAGPGGGGRPTWVDVVPAPDTYRGPHRGPDAGALYAGAVRDAVERRPVGAFLCEPLMSCAGQLVPAEGFVAAAFDAVRECGGLCIADEVQVGFGRAGDSFWSFDLDGVVPDIVTMGKPIGNGHPLAAVATTRAIADSFANGMEYFNTFGGNPVSCAVGSAVLDVIERKGLRERARVLGERLRDGVRGLDHPLVGDVRGRGLFIGVELVRGRETQEPAGAEAAELIESMKDLGFLLSTEGPHHNVLKIKPPLVIEEEDVDRTIDALGGVLDEVQSR